MCVLVLQKQKSDEPTDSRKGMLTRGFVLSRQKHRKPNIWWCSRYAGQGTEHKKTVNKRTQKHAIPSGGEDAQATKEGQEQRHHAVSRQPRLLSRNEGLWQWPHPPIPHYYRRVLKSSFVFIGAIPREPMLVMSEFALCNAWKSPIVLIC